MPRGFSEQEREIIRARLLEHGRVFLASYGLRKTSVEDLTDAAGISKGAFYAFFPSKEDLFLTVFEEFEQEYRGELLALAEQAGGGPEERVGRVLDRAVTLWRSRPLFRHFGKEEFEQIARRVAPERLAAGVRSDERFAEDLFDRWRASGVAIGATSAEFTGLMRALFFVALHAEDFEPEMYEATIGALTRMVARGIIAAR